MSLGREAVNYKPKVNENDFSAQMLLSEVKRMSYLLVMKNKQEIKSVLISHSYFSMSWSFTSFYSVGYAAFVPNFFLTCSIPLLSNFSSFEFKIFILLMTW